MKISSEDYDTLLKVLIAGLEDKVITVAVLKDELKYNKQRTDELGPHKVDPIALLSEYEAEEEKPKPKPKKKEEENGLPLHLREYGEEVGDLLYFPKKLLEEVADYRKYSKEYRKSWLAKMTRAKTQQADADGYNTREAFEKSLEDHYKAWKPKKK